jgi:hypothetical protein
MNMLVAHFGSSTTAYHTFISTELHILLSTVHVGCLVDFKPRLVVVDDFAHCLEQEALQEGQEDEDEDARG